MCVPLLTMAGTAFVMSTPQPVLAPLLTSFTFNHSHTMKFGGCSPLRGKIYNTANRVPGHHDTHQWSAAYPGILPAASLTRLVSACMVQEGVLGAPKKIISLVYP